MRSSQLFNRKEITQQPRQYALGVLILLGLTVSIVCFNAVGVLFDTHASLAWAQEAPAAIPPGVGASAAASTGVPPQPSFSEVLFKMLPMFVMVFFIFYFLVLRPQQQKLRDQQALIGSLKRGDTVVTTGGIIAKVAQVDEDAIQLEIAPNVKVRFEMSHVSKRFEKPTTKNEGGGNESGAKDKNQKGKSAA